MKKINSLLVAVLASCFVIFSAFTVAPTVSSTQLASLTIHLDDDDDIAVVSMVAGALMKSDREDGVLAVNFLIEDEQKGETVLFGVESMVTRRVELTVTDEEGAVVTNRVMEIAGGENFRSLNVIELPEGTYLFKLEEDGKSVSREVTIVSHDTK